MVGEPVRRGRVAEFLRNFIEIRKSPDLRLGPVSPSMDVSSAALGLGVVEGEFAPGANGVLALDRTKNYFVYGFYAVSNCAPAAEVNGRLTVGLVGLDFILPARGDFVYVHVDPPAFLFESGSGRPVILGVNGDAVYADVWYWVETKI